MCQSRVHRTVRCALNSVRCPGYQLAELDTLGKVLRLTGYNSSDCPVCQPRAWPTVGRTISVRHVRRTNGHEVAPNFSVRHRTVRCAKWPMARNRRLGWLRKGIGDCAVFGVHRTVRCAPDSPVHPRTEGNEGLPNGVPMARRSLGAIKGPLCALELYTSIL
jgi:hypothetical protein